jgi:hypothetical protein
VQLVIPLYFITKTIPRKKFNHHINSFIMKTIMLFLIMCVVTASVSAQTKPYKTATAQQTAQYTCPMHPEVVATQPGKCPKCGMDLNIAGKDLAKANAKNLNCPMHPNVACNSQGQCPKCTKKTDVSAKEPVKNEVIRISYCRMHPDVVLDKDGNCYECAKSASAKGF